MKYCQCTLQKRTETGYVEVVSYIPQKYAKLDNTLRLKEENGEWQTGYTVKTVGEPIDESLLPDRHEEVKAHRRATGDSLPRKN